MRWRSKLAEWIGRYGLAEICGSVSAVAGALLMRKVTGNDVLAAYGGAIGENVGYYGLIIGRELRANARTARERGERSGASDLIRTGRNLVLEFGPAELLDTGLIRPLAMGIGAHYLGATAGVLVGKIAADVTFYVPVIVAYEVRRYFARLPQE